MKCLVAISVSREWVETEFLMQMGTWQVPSKWQVKFGWGRQFTAAERHNVFAHETVYNYDRVIFMDTDQLYPPDYLMRMLEHDEPVVSALNVSRYHPFEYTTYRLESEETLYGILIPRFLPVAPPTDERVFECDITGTGAMMVQAEVFKKLPVPYFKDVYDHEGAVRLVPDDFYFGWQLNKAGYKVTVDQGIVVKHIAKMVVSPYNTNDMRKAWETTHSGFGSWKDGKQA
jgi:hypothetical protein